MRAFASALLMAVLLTVLLLLLSFKVNSGVEFGKEISRAGAAEIMGGYGEMGVIELKNSMKEVASQNRPMNARSIKETQVKIGKRLEEFEVFVEREMEEKGLDVDMWCGVFSPADSEELVRRMSVSEKAEKCAGCWDFSSKTVLVGRDTVEEINTCAFLVQIEPELFGGKVGVGNSLLSLIYDDRGELLVPLDMRLKEIVMGKNLVFGMSIYDEKTGAASIHYLPQGEFVEY